MVNETTRQLSELLRKTGWRNLNDAQSTELEKAIDKVRAIVSPPIRNGGSVHPSTSDVHQLGMSLREHFAGQALQGLLSSRPSLTTRAAAETACNYADALLAELAKPAEPK